MRVELCFKIWEFFVIFCGHSGRKKGREQEREVEQLQEPRRATSRVAKEAKHKVGA